MKPEEIIKRISAYKTQQIVLLRLLRKKGQFTASEFDKWFRKKEQKNFRFSSVGIDGDSFILGNGNDGSWSFYLDLLQYMIKAGLVAAKTINSEVVYSPMEV